MNNEICEFCEKEIPEGTGDEFLDKNCGYKFWLCDECIDIYDRRSV
jgi:ribosomal protein L24E